MNLIRMVLRPGRTTFAVSTEEKPVRLMKPDAEIHGVTEKHGQ